jgi:hypothetical protein
MDVTINSRVEKIYDYFHLKAPKPISMELWFKIMVGLIVYYPAVKVFTGSGTIAFISLGVLFFFLFLFWLKPRSDKKIKYNHRVAPEILNNWFLESLKTKVLEKAIDYLDIETKDFKPEQFIIIPYPVLHSGKNIKEDQLLREKTEYIVNINSTDQTLSYYNYSFWNIQVLMLGKNFISFYFCSYNWLNDEILNEKSNEYYYNEIALIKTGNEEVNFKSKWHEQAITDVRMLKIIHSSGDSLNIIAEIPELQQAPQTIVSLEKIEKTLRVLIRHARAKDESRKLVDIEFKESVPFGETIEI